MVLSRVPGNAEDEHHALEATDAKSVCKSRIKFCFLGSLNLMDTHIRVLVLPCGRELTTYK